MKTANLGGGSVEGTTERKGTAKRGPCQGEIFASAFFKSQEKQVVAVGSRTMARKSRGDQRTGNGESYVSQTAPTARRLKGDGRPVGKIWGGLEKNKKEQRKERGRGVPKKNLVTG